MRSLFLLLSGILYSIIAAAQVTADFSATPTNGCAPLSVQFTDNSTGATSYSWNLGNGTSALQNPIATYTPGQYTVTLTVTGPGGTAVKTINNYIDAYDLPQGSFSATNRIGCAPLNVQFSAAVTVSAPGTPSYSWDFGDGNSGTGASPTHVYASAGVYTVQLIVKDGANCTSSFTQTSYVTVYQPPVADFQASQYIFCNTPATVNFSNASSGFGTLGLNWNLGNGTFSTAQNPSSTFTSSGNYFVALTVTDGHTCTDIKTAGISVNLDSAQFAQPAAICPDDSATFSNTTPGNNGAHWDFGDGDTAVGNTVRHRFPPSGSFIVTMTTIVGLCQKTVKRTVMISPKPAASITITSSVACPRPDSLTFTANSPLATAWNWYWASGGSDTGQTVKRFYPFQQAKWMMDSVVLVTISADGCRDTVRRDSFKIHDIKVHIQPGFIVDACIGAPIQYSTLLYTTNLPLNALVPEVPYPLPANSWDWDFGDGTTAAGAYVTHAFAAAGTYNVRCIVTTVNGCMDTGYAITHIDTQVHPSFAGGPVTVCPRTWITLYNTTANPLLNTIYTWRCTDTFITMNTTDSVRMKLKFSGIYPLMLTADHRGCIDTFVQQNYLNVLPPGSGFYDSILCPPSTVVFFTNYSYQATSHVWYFGDGDTSTVLSPSHTYPLPGAYVVKLITYNSTYGCTDTLLRPLYLKPPALNFSVSDSSVCRGDTVTLIGSFGGDGSRTVYYRWRTDGLLTPFAENDTFRHTYNTRGIYDVTLITQSGNGCIDSFARTRRVSVAQPAVNFGAYPPTGCQPLNVLFRDSTTDIPGATTVSRFWDFGNDTATVPTPVVNHLYPQKGKYTVKLYVRDDAGCSDSLTRTDYIAVRAPKADFRSADTSICVNGTSAFINTSTGSSTLQYFWNFGDGGTATAQQPTHQYHATGQYSVRLVVTDSTGCTDTLLRANYVRIKAPHAAFTASDTLVVCGPLQDTFINASTGASALQYHWDFGDGGTAPATNPTRIYPNSGIYQVVLAVTDAEGCRDTARQTVRVLGYDGAFSYAPLAGCAPLRVSFASAVGNVAQVTWDFGDGGGDTGTTATYTYATPGVYLPKAVFRDAKGCNKLSKGLDSIHVDRLVAGFNTSVPCVGVPFMLRDSSIALHSAANSWLWRFGQSDAGSGKTTTYSAPSSGPLVVTLIVGNAIGCSDTLTKSVFINPRPPVTAPPDTAMCPGDTLRLIAGGAGHYAWSLGSGGQYLSCDSCDTTYFHPRSVQSSVIYLSGVDSNACVGYDSMRVVIQLKTSSSAGLGGDICAGQSFRLHADGAQSYEWLPAQTLDSPLIASPLARPLITTTYIVAAREGTCLVDSQSVTVTVHDLPPFDAGPDEWINLGSAIILHPTQGGIDHILWRSDSTLSCLDCFRPVAHPFFTRTYWATGWNEWGCATTDSVTVHVRCNGGLTFIPNTFTPNGDGVNDYFYPRGEGIERMTAFRIFDRWGELVFERRGVPLNDEQSGWDGSYKGKALPPDTYFYVMESRCESGEPVTWKGDVTLMR